MNAKDFAFQQGGAYTNTQMALYHALRKANIRCVLEKWLDCSHFYIVDENKRWYNENAFLNHIYHNYKNCSITYFKKYYALDICIESPKLLDIEIDGITHNKRESKDQLRDTILTELGYTVKRFQESELDNKTKLQEAVKKIQELL